jgi:hypothetical protein
MGLVGFIALWSRLVGPMHHPVQWLGFRLGVGVASGAARGTAQHQLAPTPGCFPALLPLAPIASVPTSYFQQLSCLFVN